MTGSLHSALDANINRCMEGLRVCEDIFRFYFLKHDISIALKKLRHDLKHSIENIPGNKLLSARDVGSDEQKFADEVSGGKRENIHEIFMANIHRSIEAARVIEELTKIFSSEISASFQRLRFSLYDLEKTAVLYILKSEKISKLTGRLYAILDSEFVKDDRYIETAEAFIRGGAGVIQLRMKNSSAGKYLSAARIISEICRQSDVLFIVNDYPDAAFLSESDGLHLGQDDIPVSDAVKIITHDSIIGISTHSIDQVKIASAGPADYIAAGPVFSTSSKNGNIIHGTGTEIISAAGSLTEKPVVAIGGINRENISDVIESGADSAAVILALYKNEKYEDNARELSDRIMESYKKHKVS